MAQGEGSEFKLQYWKNKKEEEEEGRCRTKHTD
jgi:hypothetical protein